MALKAPISPRIFAVHGVFDHHLKSRKSLEPQSKIRHFRRLQLQLELISDQGDEFGIRGFSLGITDGVAKKSLQGIQIPSVPGYFDGVADSTFHPAGGGLEGLRHLGIEDFRDGVGVLSARLGSLLDALFETYK